MMISVHARVAVNEAWMNYWRGRSDELPDGMPSTFRMTASFGPGTGRKLRGRIERLRTALVQDGYDVQTCVVGRKRQLVRTGHLPKSARAEQDQWGLAAVVFAVKSGTEMGDGDGAGERDPLRPMPPLLPRAAALPIPEVVTGGDADRLPSLSFAGLQ